MQLYRLTYDLQNKSDLRQSLRDFCDEVESVSDRSEFIWKIPFTVEKRYTISDEENIINETLTAEPYYLLCSASAAILAVWLIQDNFQLILIDLIWYILLLPGAITLFILPYLLMNHQPAEFYAKQQSTFGLFRYQPSPFLTETQISPIVYVNSLIAGVVILPVVFPSPNILAAVFPVSVLAIFLIWQNRSDPASDNMILITALTVLPFSIPLINLTMYSQYEDIMAQNGYLISQITPSVFNPINELILSIFQSQTVGLVLTLPISVLLPIRIMKLVSDNTSRINTYEMPTKIRDKKHLRAGALLLCTIYIGGSLSLFLTQLAGYPIVPVDSVMAGVLVYWPLFILVPSWYVIWYQNLWHSSVDQEGDFEKPAFEIEGIPVFFGDLDRKAAFPISDDASPAIVLNKKLKGKLNDDEIAAICYHELYHIKHDSIKYQKWIDVPVIGYVLFFLQANLSELYNEEYAADEFAAEKVGASAVISTLENVKQLGIGQAGSPVRQHLKKGWRGYVRLLFSPPVLSLYSPPRQYRINRLEEKKSTV